MDKETYEIELVAVLDKLKSGLNTAKDMMSSFGKKVKEDFKVGFEIDKEETRDSLDALQDMIGKTVIEVKEKLQQLENAKIKLGSLKLQQEQSGFAGGPLAEAIRKQQEEVNKLSMSYNDAKQQIKTYSQEYKELNNTLEASNNLFGNIGQKIKMSTIAVKEAFGNLKQTGKDAVVVLKDTNSNLNETGSVSGKVGSGLSSAFTKGLKSLKRFALSLFGIQSVWRVLSKASSAYLSQNEELSNKIKAVWNGLGTLIGPVIDYLADLFLKFIGYINVMTKALWNFDFVAKANTATLNKQAKEAKNATKALLSIDELNNLDQQNNASKNAGLLEIPELDDSLVKKLQDLSYWLKDNWDWLSKVGIALGIVFGAVEIGKFVNNIGSLIGATGAAGGIGATGLLGLAAVLIWTYDIIALWDLKKQSDEIQQYAKAVEKANERIHESYMLILRDRNEVAKSYKAGSQELIQYIAQLQSNIEMNEQDMKSHSKKTEVYKNAEAELRSTIQAYKELYEQGKLNESQTQTYAKYMQLLGYNIDGTKMTTENYRAILRYFGVDEKNTNEILNDSNKKYEILNEMIKIATGRQSDFKLSNDNLKNSLRTSDDIVKDYQKSLDTISSKDYQIDIKTKLEEPDTRSFVQKLKDAFKNLNPSFGITGSIMGGLLAVPKLAIGTDRVNAEGYAYLHKGESVVPADVVSGGYTGNNEETNSLLRTLIQTLEDKQFSASIGADEVGRASVNYIRNQNRIMGGSVI